MGTNTDRIEKKVLLKAPCERVWRAISDSKEFGTWFGVAFDGPFVAGADSTGKIAPTKVDPEVARLQRPHEGRAFTISVNRIEPMRLFSFRWHPGAIDPAVDYSDEPTTLVEFVLEEVPGGGTMLTITESGFDRIPLKRRLKAFAGNDAGWSHQARLIEKFLVSAT
jgi:uncharacterized protein YndB with AHSA1/START domain